MSLLAIIGPNKVQVSPEGIEAFNRTWPGSRLRPERSYWFEFGPTIDLIDTDCPEQDDGPEAKALANDCEAFLLTEVLPAWAK